MSSCGNMLAHPPTNIPPPAEYTSPAVLHTHLRLTHTHTQIQVHGLHGHSHTCTQTHTQSSFRQKHTQTHPSPVPARTNTRSKCPKVQFGFFFLFFFFPLCHPGLQAALVSRKDLAFHKQPCVCLCKRPDCANSAWALMSESKVCRPACPTNSAKVVDKADVLSAAR